MLFYLCTHDRILLNLPVCPILFNTSYFPHLILQSTIHFWSYLVLMFWLQNIVIHIIFCPGFARWHLCVTVSLLHRDVCAILRTFGYLRWWAAGILHPIHLTTCKFLCAHCTLRCSPPPSLPLLLLLLSTVELFIVWHCVTVLLTLLCQFVTCTL